MKKGMYDMEYASFIFNIVIGFVCALLGLLHLFDTKKEMVPKTGLIGLGLDLLGLFYPLFMLSSMESSIQNIMTMMMEYSKEIKILLLL